MSACVMFMGMSLQRGEEKGKPVPFAAVTGISFSLRAATHAGFRLYWRTAGRHPRPVAAGQRESSERIGVRPENDRSGNLQFGLFNRL